MQRELESQNLQLAISCKQQMEQLIAYGLQRMRTSKALDNSGHIMQAERNLRALIKYLCDFSREDVTFPVLGQARFDAAISNCPTFWPYCTSG